MGDAARLHEAMIAYGRDYMVEKGFTDANVIVTSDMAHHQIKQLVESGKAIILLTHYASENYGFNQFYAQVLSQLTGKRITQLPTSRCKTS